jgi:hypothetical protein
MSTHDYIVDNQNGANFRSDLNNALAAIVSNNSSATAPTTTYAFMLWADTANDLLKQRNAADSAWVDILTLSTGAVSNAEVADNAITLAKMAHGTDGEIITYDASGAPATVGVGTSGQVLTSNGAGSAPSMQSPAAAGADTSLSNLSSTGENKVCQAWVNFNGTGTVAIRDSHNVSSITDNGTGDYFLNFSSSLANANYMVNGISGRGSVNRDEGAGRNWATTATTSRVRVWIGTSTGSLQDYPNADFIIFGD